MADGGKAILYRNQDSHGGLSLREEGRFGPKHLLEDGPSGSRPEDQTPSQTDEATFAKQLAKAINKMKLAGDFDKLVLVADPQTLGQFREVMHKTVEQSLGLTLAKDLTNHSPGNLTKVNCGRQINVLVGQRRMGQHRHGRAIRRANQE